MHEELIIQNIVFLQTYYKNYSNKNRSQLCFNYYAFFLTSLAISYIKIIDTNHKTIFISRFKIHSYKSILNPLITLTTSIYLWFYPYPSNSSPNLYNWKYYHKNIINYSEFPLKFDQCPGSPTYSKESNSWSSQKTLDSSKFNSWPRNRKPKKTQPYQTCPLWTNKSARTS